MAYNLFNHPLLGNPDLEVTSATFGQIRTSLAHRHGGGRGNVSPAEPAIRGSI